MQLDCVLCGQVPELKKSVLTDFAKSLDPEISDRALEEIAKPSPDASKKKFSSVIDVDGKSVNLNIYCYDGKPGAKINPYDGMELIFFCYSVTSSASLEAVRDEWAPDAKKRSKNAKTIVAALNCGERMTGSLYGVRSVPQEYGISVAQHIGAVKHHDVFPSNHQTVAELFYEAIRAKFSNVQRKSVMHLSSLPSPMKIPDTSAPTPRALAERERAGSMKALRASVNGSPVSQVSSPPPAGSPSSPSTMQSAGLVTTVRFDVGNISCVAIMDGSRVVKPSEQFSNWVQEECAEQLAHYPRTLEGLLPVWYNCLLIKSGKDIVVVNAGSSKDLGGGLLKEGLAKENIPPTAVTHVVLTHVHPDSVASAGVFPNAKVWITKAEQDYWRGTPDLKDMKLGNDYKQKMSGAYKEFIAPIQSRVEAVEEETSVVKGVDIVPLSGNTPGAAVVRVKGGNDRLYYVGDLFTHELHLKYPQWHHAYCHKPEEAVAKLKKLLDQVEEESALVMAYKLPFPGLGRVRTPLVAGSPKHDQPSSWRFLRTPDLRHALDAFNVFDVDGNGSMDLKELEVCVQGLGLNPTKAELKDLLVMADKNRNGKIEVNEFVNLMANLKINQTLIEEDEFMRAFAVFDKNGDGLLSVDELRNGLMTMGDSVTEEEAELLFQEADINQDGKVDQRELVKFLTQRM